MWGSQTVSLIVHCEHDFYKDTDAFQGNMQVEHILLLPGLLNTIPVLVFRMLVVFLRLFFGFLPLL